MDTTTQSGDIFGRKEKTLGIIGIMLFCLFTVSLVIWSDINLQKRRFSDEVRNALLDIRKNARNIDTLLVSLSSWIRDKSRFHETRFTRFSVDLLRSNPVADNILIAESVPANKRSHYLPIRHFSPANSLLGKFTGFDLLSDTYFSKLLERSLLSRLTMASIPHSFAKKSGHIIIFKPVHSSSEKTGRLYSFRTLRAFVGVMVNPVNLIDASCPENHGCLFSAAKPSPAFSASRPLSVFSARWCWTHSACGRYS